MGIKNKGNPVAAAEQTHDGLNVRGIQDVVKMDPIFMQDAVNDLAGFLRSFSAGLSVDGIAIGFPATLDRSRRVVVQAPNIPFMENLPVCDYLQIVLQAAFWPPDFVSSRELHFSPEPVH